ncbi:hypothetical protein M513_06558 [Trichuris suis]|uniref:Uncharacterized protein n=1 Tax=Trichuris suis TaxID=68888 RepID=A0A085M5M8_9BILA|nr:hypothetical protein M513_06558 [Trichuris suis]
MIVSFFVADFKKLKRWRKQHPRSSRPVSLGVQRVVSTAFENTLLSSSPLQDSIYRHAAAKASTVCILLRPLRYALILLVRIGFPLRGRNGKFKIWPFPRDCCLAVSLCKGLLVRFNTEALLEFFSSLNDDLLPIL